MVGSHPQHADAVQVFLRWIRSQDVQLQGFGGPDFETERSFIPRLKLEEYYGRPRQLENLLDAVLTGKERSDVDADYVKRHYGQTFAILLSIDQGHLIHQFYQRSSLRDQKLPHRTRPEEFPITTPDKFEEFRAAQWQFCASTLEYGMDERFKEEDIIPIIQRERIGEGGSAIVYKIVIDKDYHSMRPHGTVRSDHHSPYKNTFVLKTYRSDEAEEYYKVERDAYMKLRWAGKPSLHIIAHYGGFIHGRSCNNILEYADQGTLEDFMEKAPPPTTVEDTLLFWDRLTNVAHGIMTIHGNVGSDSSAAQLLTGWHQDVKPANILAFSGDGKPYGCYFKIADLGLTHFKPSVSQSHDPSDFDVFGTRAYGAPETYRFHEDTEAAPLQVTPEVDIWSMGCVFSEAAVWACYGWKRVLEYRRQRSQEIQGNGGPKGEHTFHHEDKLLGTVENIHQNILDRRLASQRITRLVLDQLVKDMLQNGARPHARLIFDKSKRLILAEKDRFELPTTPAENFHALNLRTMEDIGQLPAQDTSMLVDDMALPSPSCRPQSPPGHHSESNSRTSNLGSNANDRDPDLRAQDQHIIPDQVISSNQTHEDPREKAVQKTQVEQKRPVLSLKEGHEWKKMVKLNQNPDLPGGENLTHLNRRDHIFLIDNSETMKQYKPDIANVVSLLAYILKGSDEDGLDIFFTQSLKSINSKRSKKLANSIYEQSFMGISDMRARLQEVLQNHIDKFGTLISTPRKYGRRPAPQSQRPLSIYILTDAKYQPTDVGGFIKSLVQSMIAKGCPKEHVALSFIRYGNDQASIARLDELDHGLGLKASGMDIVDHTYWNGNVWKQLLGPINDWYDDDPP